MIINERLKNIIPIILVGIISIVGLFIWYKDYSYFNWSNYDPKVVLSEERHKPEGGMMPSAEYNSDYAQRDDVISVQTWCLLEKHMDLSYDNNYEDSLFFSIYRYEDFKNPTLLDGVIEVKAGESWSYETHGGSYMIVTYGKLSPEESIFTANNVRYMRWYKSIVKYIIAGLVLLMFLEMIGAYLLSKKFLWNINIVVAAGALVTFILSKSFMDLESCYENIIQTIAVVMAAYAGVISVVLDKKDNEEKFEAILLPIGVSLIVFFGLLSRIMNAKTGSLLSKISWTTASMLNGYSISIIILVIVFIVSLYFINSKKAVFNRYEISFDKQALISSIILFTSAVISFSEYGIPLLLITGLIVFVIVKRFDISRIIWWIVNIFVVLLSSVKQALINIWGTDYADVYHCDSYFSSLYHVANNEPFEGGNIEKYGHHQLFYKIPMMIFGNTTLVMGICFAIVNAITVSIFIYLIGKTTKNNIIRVLGSIALLISSVYDSDYPMTLTGRLFVVALTLFAIYKSVGYIVKDDNNIRSRVIIIEITGFVLCVINVLWSTDAGIIMNIVWLTFISLASKPLKKFRELIINMIPHIFLFLLELGMAYFIIKLWNYVMSDGNVMSFWAWAGEFDPSEEFADVEANKFVFNNSHWVYLMVAIILITLYPLGKFLLSLVRGNHEYDLAEIKYIAVGITGLGMFSFYMIRPEDFLCIEDIFILIIVILIEKALDLIKRESNENRKSIKVMLSQLAIVGSCMIFTTAIANIPNVYKYEKNYIDNNQLNWNYLQNELEKFRAEVDENTYVGFGEGLTLIYMNLNRKMPDNIQKCDYLITTDYDEESLGIKADYIKTVNFDQIEYNYYKIDHGVKDDN